LLAAFYLPAALSPTDRNMFGINAVASMTSESFRIAVAAADGL
jgi:hypothetical protein